MGDTYPKRGDYEYIKKKSEEVFYDPKIATKELVDEVFESVNDRNKLIRTLAIAKSAIRHNMSKDLPTLDLPIKGYSGILSLGHFSMSELLTRNSDNFIDILRV